MALTHKFSKQHWTIFLEPWLVVQKENDMFSDLFLFQMGAEMAWEAGAFAAKSDP